MDLLTSSLICFALFIVAVIIKLYSPSGILQYQLADSAADNQPIEYQVFKGTKLNYAPGLLHAILCKYFVYYKELSEEEQQRFLTRLQAFMKSKTYAIPAAEGYREMPILVSASAIQLTFGLKDFMLPWYENICVHPREYIKVNPLRTLTGNVSGKTITLSWKHFFDDYQTKNGVNVGLHEMAHALQMQHEYFYKQKDNDFRSIYDLFESLDAHTRSMVRTGGNHLYTDYALSSTDEFWASSVELFFEQPEMLNIYYPQVYTIVKTLLNQDPGESASHPCILPPAV